MKETLEAKDQSTRLRCEVAHSELPWRVSGTFVNSDGPTIADCNCSAIISRTEAEANAAYIVKACNEYPKLVDAARNLCIAVADLEGHAEIEYIYALKLAKASESLAILVANAENSNG